MKKILRTLYLLLGIFIILQASDYDEIQKLVASDRAEGDSFCWSISISGDYAIVGAYSEDDDASGDNTLSAAGSAYIFKLDGTSWSQKAKLMASDRAAGDNFGTSVSISGDYAIIGAVREDDKGSAYIFMRDGSNWSQQAKLVAADRAVDDKFGVSVSISGDYAIVGAHFEDEDASGNNTQSNAGSAYIFMRDGINWSQGAKLVASDRARIDYFGHSVSISGDYAIVGASNTTRGAGSAYIFMRDGTSWSQQAKLVASDKGPDDCFGDRVSISGDYAIVGAYREDEDASGNNRLLDAGSAYIFKRDGTNWSQQAKLVASDRAENDWFGISISISGDYAIVGAYSEDEDASGNNTLDGAGSAYIFKRDGTSWSQKAKLVASDRAQWDLFGNSVSISDDYAIVGAQGEDEDASGNNTLDGAGSIYIFNMPAPEVSAINIPSAFLLHQNYPNPFNPITAISYELSAISNVDLSIYDMNGKKVATLVNGSKLAGYHSVNWDASNVGSGIYFYRLQAGSFVETKKMVFMK
jgi:phosphopantetheinyl transferase